MCIFNFQLFVFLNVGKPGCSRFNVSITAYALGEIFNEPWHPNLLTSMDVAYPSDMLEFTVEAGGTLTSLTHPTFSQKWTKIGTPTGK